MNNIYIWVVWVGRHAFEKITKVFKGQFREVRNLSNEYKGKNWLYIVVDNR